MSNIKIKMLSMQLSYFKKKSNKLMEKLTVFIL